MEKLENWQDVLAVYGRKLIDFTPDLIAALLLLIFGLWIIRILVNQIRKIFQKKEYDVTLENFVTRLIGWGLKILLFVLVISQLGIQTTSLVAAIGAAGLAIGLALQGSLANFAGGVLIIILKPYKVGDWIEAQGVSGSVKEISLFYTKIDTFGNQRVVIPNGKLSNDNISNFSFNESRREALTISISYDSDIEKARAVLMELINEQEGVLQDPPPQVLVAELADSSVNFSVRYFAPNNLFWDIRWIMIEEAKKRLEAAGIVIPFPQRDMHFFNHSKEMEINTPAPRESHKNN